MRTFRQAIGHGSRMWDGFRRRLSTAAHDVIDIHDPRHPQHPANWDPTFPRAGPPLPQAWSDDPRNVGKVHPVMKGWLAVFVAASLWASAIHFFATGVRRDPTEPRGGSRDAAEAAAAAAAAQAAASKGRGPFPARPADRTTVEARGSGRAVPAPAPAPTARHAAALEEYLKASGVQLGPLRVAPTPEGEGPSGLAPRAKEGLGVVMGPGAHLGSHGGWLAWMGMGTSAVLARIPLAAAFTPGRVLSDPQYGPIFQKAASSGLLEHPRDLVILFLVVEKMRGKASPHAAYVSALPRSFPTPLHMSDTQLAALKGTPLYDATRALRGKLRERWQKLRPLVHEAMDACDADESLPSLDDYLWAHSAYWTRAHRLPELPGPGGAVVGGEEALVPGLDFCNHSPSPNARWEVVSGGKAGPEILLLGTPRAPPPASQVLISYGDKPDEELMFQYGFAAGRSPHNRLLVKPAPMGISAESYQARLAVLAHRGSPPFFFLPPAETMDVPFPAAALDFAEVLVAPHTRIEAELRALEQGQPEGQAAAAGAGPMDDVAAWRSFVGRPAAERMAVLSSLRGLLERTMESLEDDADGTGTLESDIRLLQGGSLAPSEVSPVVYRAGLKRMAREWLVRAKTELQEVLGELQRERAEALAARAAAAAAH